MMLEFLKIGGADFYCLTQLCLYIYNFITTSYPISVIIHKCLLVVK